MLTNLKQIRKQLKVASVFCLYFISHNRTVLLGRITSDY